MATGEFIAGGNPAMDLYPIQGEVEILLTASGRFMLLKPKTSAGLMYPGSGAI